MDKRIVVLGVALLVSACGSSSSGDSGSTGVGGVPPSSPDASDVSVPDVKDVAVSDTIDVAVTDTGGDIDAIGERDAEIDAPADADAAADATADADAGCVPPCPATATNATTIACVASKCTITQCVSGFTDCDHSVTNGCEIDLQTDEAHCGTCDTRCGAGTCNAGLCPKVVFVSSAVYDGNLGGLAGADALCQGLATAASLPGTFKAYLSTDTVTATSRLTHATVPYVLADGMVFANNWADLSSVWRHAIDLTETRAAPSMTPGTRVTSGTGAYTNTYGYPGTPASPGYTCSGWTSNLYTDAGLSSDVLLTDQTTLWWATCSVKQHLFCFEQ
jgi:hypothetical protein